MRSYVPHVLQRCSFLVFLSRQGSPPSYMTNWVVSGRVCSVCFVYPHLGAKSVFGFSDRTKSDFYFFAFPYSEFWNFVLVRVSSYLRITGSLTLFRFDVRMPASSEFLLSLCCKQEQPTFPWQSLFCVRRRNVFVRLFFAALTLLPSLTHGYSFS